MTTVSSVLTTFSPYAEVGGKLVDAGLPAIPIIPGTKRPGAIVNGAWVGLHDWQAKFRKRLPTPYEVDKWSDMPDCGVGIVAGVVVGIDIDVDDKEIVEAIENALPHTPVIKAGAKGRTLFFRANSLPCRSYNEYLPDGTRGRRLCDLIGPGRQTVLPPTIHPDTGKPYRWIGFKALQNIHLDELPLLDDDAADKIGAALAPFGYKPEPERKPAGGGVLGESDSMFRDVNNRAMADLPRWVPALYLYKCKPYQGGYRAVATWRSSHSGRALEDRSPNLKIVPAGIRDFHDNDRSYTPIDLVMAANSCDVETAYAWLSEKLGLIPEPIVFTPRATAIVDGDTIDAETGEVLHKSESIGAFDLLEAFPPGLVGRIAEWSLSISRRPQKRLAVAAALSIVSALASRQMVTPEHGALNLFTIVSAPSGHGKDAPLSTIKAVLAATRLGEILGPGGIASDVALDDIANRQPVCLMPIDEFGDFLGSISGSRAPPHATRLLSGMRKLYDAKSYKTSHAAMRHSVYLHSPCVSIFGTTTPGQFYDAMTSKQVADGFLNRFLLVNGDAETVRGVGGRFEDVPADIVEMSLSIANRAGGMNSARFRMGPAEDPVAGGEAPYRVPWLSEAAKTAWDAYEDAVLARMAEDKETGEFAARAAQNALKIATVVAISENPGFPAVDEIHVEYGISFAERSLRDMIDGFNGHVREAGNSDIREKILAKLRKSGGQMTQREIMREFRRAFKTAKELEECMKILVEAGEVDEPVRVKTNGQGRPTTLYSLAKPAG